MSEHDPANNNDVATREYEALKVAIEDAEKRLRGAGMLGGADDPVRIGLEAIRQMASRTNK